MEHSKFITHIATGVYFLVLGIVILSAILWSNKSIFYGDVIKVPLDSMTIGIQGNSYYMMFKLDDDSIGKTYTLHTHDSFVDVQVNSKNIYHYGNVLDISDNPGFAYQVFNIDKEDGKAGDVVKIVLSPAYNMKIELPQIYYGTSNAIMKFLIKNDMWQILSVIIMLFTSLIAIILSLIYSRSGNRTFGVSIKYTGLTALLIVIWSACNLYITQMIIQSGIIIYFIYYTSMQLIPITYVKYIRSISVGDFKDMTAVYMTIVTIVNILQFIGVKEYPQTNKIVFLSAILLVIYTIVQYVLKGNMNNVPKILIIGITCAIFSIIFGIVLYSLGVPEIRVYRVSFTGVCIYLICSVVNSIKKKIEEDIQDNENRITANLAKTDPLTGLGNRLAYNSDIQNLHLCDVGIISIDLNNLKFYNDTKGHPIGDKLLIYAAYALTYVFGSNAVYRTGGDEFIAIYPDASFSNFESDCKKLKAKCAELEKECNEEFILEIALGIAYGNSNTKTDEELLKAADLEMYKNKKIMKENSRIDKSGYVDDRLNFT